MKILNSNLSIVIILIVSTLFFYSSAAVSQPGDDNDKISYLVTIDRDQPKLARVQISFTATDSILYMGSGANELPKRWATFVTHVKAVNASGKTITLEELPDAQWKIHTPLHEQITLSYEVQLNHEDHTWSGGIDGVAYAKDWGVFYTGRSLFIMNGTGRKNIQVNFILPDTWKVTTPWEPENNTGKAFISNSLTELSQAMIFAGTHEEITIKRKDFELVFALGGPGIIAHKEDFRKLAEGVFDYYINLMGGIPNPSSENKFNKTVVIVNPANVTDGEVIGNNISILIQLDGDQMSEVVSRFIFAHEFFHLWNGKSFFPENDRTEWFKEGFTNYYTLKSLHHIGYLNDDSFLQLLSSFFYQRYSNDEGVGTLSMTNGAEKHGHWGLIYGGGLLVGISQDVIIRNATNNTKSLDDLMRTLFNKYGGTDAGYSLKELEQLMTELSGIGQTEFFNTYVTGTKEIPIADYLNTMGLNATVENKNLVLSKKGQLSPLQKDMLLGFFGHFDTIRK